MNETKLIFRGHFAPLAFLLLFVASSQSSGYASGNFYQQGVSFSSHSDVWPIRLETPKWQSCNWYRDISTGVESFPNF